jgi:hypothetical protein
LGLVGLSLIDYTIGGTSFIDRKYFEKIKTQNKEEGKNYAGFGF